LDPSIWSRAQCAAAQIPPSQFNNNQMHSIVDLNESSNATVASQLAAASSRNVGGGQLTSANPRNSVSSNSVSVSCVSFHAGTPVWRY